MMVRPDHAAAGPPQPPLKVDRSSVPGAVVCALRGDLDLDTCPAAAALLSRTVEPGVGVLCLDLRDVQFCGLPGLNLLLRVRALAEQADVPLALVAPSTRVARLLELVGTESLFHVYSYCELAVDELGADR